MILQIVEKEVNGVTVLGLWGELILGEESRRLRTKINEMLAEGKKRLVLDLAHVRRLDSTGLGTLIAAYTSARSQGGIVKLAALAKLIRQQLTITKLVTVFEVFDSVDDAVKSF